MTNLETQIEECTKKEKSLAKTSKGYLQSEVKRSHKVIDLKGLGKWELIGMILRADYGVKVLSKVEGWN